jgi:hypothetical protein
MVSQYITELIGKQGPQYIFTGKNLGTTLWITGVLTKGPATGKITKDTHAKLSFT